MKIICVGRNYAGHIKELKSAVPEDAVLFLKPDSAILPPKNPFVIPEFSKDMHYETELVIRINRIGKHIDAKFAHKYYDEIGLGIDFTARDLQHDLASKGLPWEKSKAFDGSCVVGSFFPKHSFEDIGKISFELRRNEEAAQTGNSKDMIRNFDQLISVSSEYFTLKIGDLIFTGTPEGVGAVHSGDKLSGFIEGRQAFAVFVK